MLQVFNRSRSTAAVPANAVTSVENSSDEILVERIAAGDKLAMQVLFARHRTKLYRWLLQFVGNETVAEDLLSDVFFDVWQQAGRLTAAPPSPLGCSRSPASRPSRPGVVEPMWNWTKRLKPLWPTAPALESKGLIRSSRGAILVRNRKGIERSAGGTYGVPEKEL